MEFTSYDESDFEFIHVTKEGCIRFEVRAKWDARIILAPTKSVTGKSLMIIIGLDKNPKIITSRVDNNKNLRLIESPDDRGWVDDENFREYYLFWDQESFGIGESDRKEITSEKHPGKFAVQYVGVSTGPGSTGSWKIGEVELETGDDEKQWTFTTLSGRVDFSVKTKGKAKVCLTGIRRREIPIITVAFGCDNMNGITLRKNKELPNKVTIAEQNAVMENEFRRYSLMWNQTGTYTVMKGSDSLLEWMDPEPFGIAYFGLMSVGATAQWEIHRINRKKMTVIPFKRVYQFYERASFNLLVRCNVLNDARIALTGIPEDNGENSIYEIFFGNDTSMLQRNRVEPVKGIAKTPGILGDGFSTFQIVWEEKVLKIGLANEPPFIVYHEPNPFGMGYYGLYGKGEWIIEEKRIETDDSDLRFDFYPFRSGIIDFHAKVSADLHIILSTKPKESFPMYEIIIGGWGNMVSAIRFNKEQPDKVRVLTPNICRFHAPREYAVSWSTGYITVSCDNQVVMTLHDPDMFGVSYHAVWTPEGNASDIKYNLHARS